jgi:hypothetical protein
MKIHEQPGCGRQKRSKNHRSRRFTRVFKLLMRWRFRKEQPAKKFHHACTLRQLPAYANFETLNFSDDWKTIWKTAVFFNLRAGGWTSSCA